MAHHSHSFAESSVEMKAQNIILWSFASLVFLAVKVKTSPLLENYQAFMVNHVLYQILYKLGNAHATWANF